MLSPAGVVADTIRGTKAASSSRPEEDPSTCCCMTVTTRPYFDSSIRSVSVWFLFFLVFLFFFFLYLSSMLLLCSCVCRLVFARFVLSVGILCLCVLFQHVPGTCKHILLPCGRYFAPFFYQVLTCSSL